MGRGCLKGSEILMILSCLDNRLTDGGEVEALHTGSALLPRDISVSVSGTHLC
jgi:hypothetical protein